MSRGDIMNRIKKNPSFLISTLVVSASVILIQNTYSAEITKSTFFKCINAQGEVFYKDKPCPVSDKEKKIKVAITPKSIIKNNPQKGSVQKHPVGLSAVAEKANRDFKRNENERKDRENELRSEQGSIDLPQPIRN